MTSLNQSTSSSGFAWVNTQILAQSLSTGELDLAVGLSQFSAIVRDVFAIFESQSRAHCNSQNEARTKCKKMEKLLADLSEKCQGLQQALLYKEEKYDEKCREVERYKLICELSARSAVDGDVGDVDSGGEQNDFSLNELMRSREVLDQCNSFDRGANMATSRGSIVAQPVRSVVSHVKYRYATEPPGLPGDASANCPAAGEQRQASDYLGGPSKARPKINFTVPKIADYGLQRAMANIGGVNVGSPSARSFAPVPQGESPAKASSTLNNSTGKIKVELTGQRNEVMSSSRNAVDRLRQKFTEKDLHRQLAGGCWTRMSSRRRKEWPF